MCVTLGVPTSGETRAVDHYESTKAVIQGETLYLISNDQQKLATTPLTKQGQATVLKLPVSEKENVPRCWDVMGETLYITRVHNMRGGPLDPSTCNMVIPLTPVTPTYSVWGYGELSKESDGI